jgi:hypothetical protein
MVVDFLQASDIFDSEHPDSPVDMELMHWAADGIVDVPPIHSILLHCVVQGHPATFLLDFGGNNSFISDRLAQLLEGQVALSQSRRVKVARGGVLQCKSCFPNWQSTCGTHWFNSSFKILPLQGYDGIIGMDWLSTHSPQLVNWQ